jgi:enoyl-CoA hydratase/carnithine racemase
MVQQIIEDNIMIAKFDNPPAYSMTFDCLNVIRDAVKKVNEDDSLKGLIFTGEGKFFCSGFDLPTFISFKTREDVLGFFNVEEEMLYEIFTCKKPVIAAINGHCTAGGFIVAMGCDYRIATDNPKAKMGMTETKIGLSLTIAEMELVRSGLNSDKLVRDIMYDGERHSFEQGKEMGFVDQIVPEAELMDAAKKRITYWWDQPGHAFTNLKYCLKYPIASQMRYRLDNENWQDSLCEAITNPQLKAIFEMVQKAMSGGK